MCQQLATDETNLINQIVEVDYVKNSFKCNLHFEFAIFLKLAY